jgi:hypothetical protein
MINKHFLMNGLSINISMCTWGDKVQSYILNSKKVGHLPQDEPGERESAPRQSGKLVYSIDQLNDYRVIQK